MPTHDHDVDETTYNSWQELSDLAHQLSPASRMVLRRHISGKLLDVNHAPGTVARAQAFLDLLQRLLTQETWRCCP